MGTKAYLMIKMTKKYGHDSSYLEAVRDLEAIPEVESVKPVSGGCDLLAKVDAPIRVIFVANKIRALKWVEGLRILEVESEPAEASKVTIAEVLEGR